MTKTVIIPYTPKRVTLQDITRLRTSLIGLCPDVCLKAFDISYVPLWLADNFTSDTITVTLNSDWRPDIFDFVPGPQFFATQHSKSKLLKELIKADIPVPHSVAFSLDLKPTEALFGPYVAIKTTAPGTTRAHGISVCKTSEFNTLKSRVMKEYQNEIANGHIPLVQRYIPTGPNPCNATVTTFLGAPIVCFTTTALLPFDPKKMSGIVRGEATSNFENERSRQLVDDDAFVELARKVATVYPETSVLSIDMVRCAETGGVYCLEANLGNLSVLSAPICDSLRRDLGSSEVLKQFSAYRTMAKRIIEILDGDAMSSD